LSLSHIFTLSLHDALPIWLKVYFPMFARQLILKWLLEIRTKLISLQYPITDILVDKYKSQNRQLNFVMEYDMSHLALYLVNLPSDRKSTRLNSSHVSISYA